MLLDLSAAFDTVNHQIRLSTLSSLSITGTALHPFESYLTGRSFRVALGGEVSKSHQLVIGVPHGSVLGPLLFSIYTGTHHIGTYCSFSYHCYTIAMLMKLSSTAHFNQMIQWHLHGSQPDWWTSRHGLKSITCSSTWQKWSFSSSQPPISTAPVQLGSSTIIPLSLDRKLGVILDDQLTFKDLLGLHCTTLERSGPS